MEKTPHGAKHLIATTEHQNEQVTCLQWNEASNELFVGDSSGKVSIVTVSLFPSKAMFQTPSFVLMQLDSKIVQMDFYCNMLLVSTLTKCYICDTKKEVFRQVGHKLRDGEYGACIFNPPSNRDVIINSERVQLEKTTTEHTNLSSLKLFCARPGSRIWECTIDGTVISTHHFKEALAIPPRKIYFLQDGSNKNSDLNNGIFTNGSSDTAVRIDSNYAEQSFNFQKLNIFMSKYFYTFKSDGIYLFDPQKSAVVLWNNEITNIVDVKSSNDVIYVWSGYSKMYALNVVPVEKFLIRLYFQKKYVQLAKLCLEFESFLLSEASDCNKLHVLQDLDEKLKSLDGFDNICNRLKPLISLCKENAQKRKVQNAQKLKSGIYLIARHDQMLLDDGRVSNQKIVRPSYLNLKGRSHSVSPERFHRDGVSQHGSASSLPDLVIETKSEDNINVYNEPIVNGRKDIERKPISQPKVDVEIISKIVEILKKPYEPSQILVFNLLNSVLDLGHNNNSLEKVESLPLTSYFSEEEINSISDIFHFGLTSKITFEWLSKFNGDVFLNAVEKLPQILVKNYSRQSLELDYKLSKVLKLFSSVLKEVEIIETIRKTEMDCYFCSLLEVLNTYQESSLSSVSDSTLNLANVSSTPKILNITYFLIKVGQIEQCSRHSKKINLIDLFYLMIKFEESLKSSGKPSEIVQLQSNTLFLSYLDKTSNVAELIETCNATVENYIISCLENINSTATCVKESNCNCGFPCPGLQPSITMFPVIGYSLVEKNWPSNREKCFEICGRISYLWKHLIYLRRNEPLDLVLPLILQSGEVDQLENRSQEVGEEILELCVKYLIKLKKGICLNCDKKIRFDSGTISWTEFGTLCIKLSSPKETLELYKKFAQDISSFELDQTFFQSLIFSSIMEKHNKGLKKNVIDLLSGKSTQDSSWISVFSDEIKDVIIKAKVEKPNADNPVKKAHHWGVKVDFKKDCYICSLPLDTKVLISEAGLVIFKCTHAFHSACLRKVNLNCPVCKGKAIDD